MALTRPLISSRSKKKACNLTEVIVRVDNRIKQQDKNVMIYEVEPGHEGTMQSASSGPKIKGKANVSDMLYGRPINDDIISIHSINDNSGRVVFSGKVFFVEDINENRQGISPYNNGYYR